MWRVLIVEDSPEAAGLLQQHLAHFGQEQGERFSVQVLTSAFDFAGGKYVADVVFLDIDLPGISGMEAAQLWRLTDQSTPLVFITNLAQFAMDGYKVQAMDYLLKPVTYRDFKLCMARALKLMERNACATVSVSAEGELHVLDQRDIVYVEVVRHYLNWHLVGTEDVALRSRGALRALAEELDPERFCRISASHLINMGQVARLRTGGVLMSDGSELLFSRSRKKEAAEAIARYAGRGV